MPKDRESIGDFDKAVKEKRTFEAENTPREVCVGYFEYVKGIVTKRIAALSEKTGIQFSVRYSVVFPPKVGAEYKKHFKSVLEEAFGCKIHKELGTTRALGMFACMSGGENGAPIVKKKENVLVFDIGEEFISTSKIMVGSKGEIVVDGSEGHKKAEPIGGVIVDEAILNYLENGVDDREQFASVGLENSAREGCPESKRYQLLKDIKVAKNILSNEKICATGIAGKKVGGIADRIYNFIKEEAENKINDDVKTVIVAGGVIETLGLGEYLRTRLKKELGKNLRTFDDEQQGSGGAFKIYANESSVYAAALGMTLAAVRDVEIKTVLSLTYGTWVYNQGLKVLKIFVERFKPLESEENTFSGDFSGNSVSEKWMDTVLTDEEMFSAVITEKECNAKKDEAKKTGSGVVLYASFESGGKEYYRLVVGEKGSSQRRVAKEAFALKEVFGDEIHIREKTTGRRVRVRKQGDAYTIISKSYPLKFQEGIVVSKNGTIKPFIKNTSPDNPVIISYWNERRKGWESTEYNRKLQDLEFYFKEGKNFKADVSDDD